MQEHVTQQVPARPVMQVILDTQALGVRADLATRQIAPKRVELSL
jgi:hypothetical protein